MFEPDYKNFKVICQECGKVGVIDTIRHVNSKTQFFWRYDCGRGGRFSGEPQIDFWLCRECLT